MIQPEDIEIGMEVIAKNLGKGVVRELWKNNASATYVVVELSCNYKTSVHISMISKLNKNEN